MECSEQIAAFLNFLRDCQDEYCIARAREHEHTDEMQDLLHHIEFDEDSYDDFAKAAEAIKEVRLNRRAAKEKRLLLQIVADWRQKNRDAISGMERLLGDVRKAEQNAGWRMFTPRTDIIERTFKSAEYEKQLNNGD